MKRLDGREYLHLVWKSPVSRRQYLIGELSKNGSFQFKYTSDVRDAMEDGFIPIIAFSDIDKIYENDKVFSVFASRLPDRKRVDIDEILQKYGMDEYDEFEFLRRSGAKLPTDHLEFIDPIFYESLDCYEGHSVNRVFQVAGSRYYIGCDSGQYCEKSININKGDVINLELESDNEFDSNAVKVLYEGKHIGYVPRCYGMALTKIINERINYNCFVSEVNKNNNCNECVKLEIIIKL